MSRDLVQTHSSYVPAVQDALARYQEHARGAFAANTERAIRSDTAIFAEWCGGQDRTSLPAAPETIAAFVDAKGTERAPATVRRYVASIGHMHRAAEAGDPTKSEVVRLALKRLSRSKGTRQKQAHGLTYDLRARMLDAADAGTVKGLRDRALLATAYDTLMRRAEVVALERHHVEFADDGSGTALVVRSKADQEGKGQLRYLAPDTVEMLQAWIDVAAITEGAVFRSVRKNSKVNGPLAAGEVSSIYKAMACAAGIKPGVIMNLSGHSTRIGAAQDLVGAGVDIAQVMRDGGWKSPEMIARYTEKQAVRAGGMAKLAAVQNRG
jgi:site-specific recombinase XerD